MQLQKGGLMMHLLLFVLLDWHPLPWTANSEDFAQSSPLNGEVGRKHEGQDKKPVSPIIVRLSGLASSFLSTRAAQRIGIARLFLLKS